MSSPKNSMELVDRYLQAVRFWLPKTAKQEDLLAELGDDLRSQIEERESELGRPLNQDEMAAILKRCGSPMVVAGRFSPNRYLIGPTLFPIYTFVLKMVLFWILVPVFVFIVTPATLAETHDVGAAIGNTIGALWSGLFIAAGVITLVFAILERTHAHAAMACQWDPLKLPPVRKEERRKPTIVQTVCQLAFAVFGIIWLLLLPHYPVLILGPAAAFLKAAPFMHPFYIPILLLGVVALLRPAITLARPHWGWFPPLAELAQAVLSLILLNFILHAAQAAFPQGQGFLVLSDAAKNSAQYVRVAAIVNISILVSLACAWLGLCIAMIVHLWQLLWYLRKRMFAGGTAPIQVQ